MDLHPGVAAAFMRLGADELGVARLMAAGDLVSPQRYENVTLFDIRITGTGISFRPSLNEYVFRKPENYLTPDFLARCNGLSVILHHPEDSLLDSKEFAERIVGSVLLPYIKGEEVWAVAKIYDDETIGMLESEQMSTSPAVLLDKDTVRTRAKLEDGTEVDLLVEGKAKLLDHIAICGVGVWDKGGPPAGISSGGQIDQANVRGDSIVADKEDVKDDAAKADAAKADAAKRMDETLDTMLKGIKDACDRMDGLGKRMDAWEESEKAKADAVKADAAKADAAKADAAKADAEESEKAEKLAADKRKDAEKDEDKEKADAAKADAARADSLHATIEKQSKQIEELAALVRQPVKEAHRGDLLALQSRADAIFTQFGNGSRAPIYLAGEAPDVYSRRLANDLKDKSKTWAKVDMFKLDDDTFSVAREQIYADAVIAAKNPTDLQPGRMRENIVQKNGHTYVTFTAGPDTHFVKQFARPARRVQAWSKDGSI